MFEMCIVNRRTLMQKKTKNKRAALTGAHLYEGLSVFCLRNLILSVKYKGANMLKKKKEVGEEEGGGEMDVRVAATTNPTQHKSRGQTFGHTAASP